MCTVNLFYSLNQNLRKPIFSHASEIWADKAGYYMYLPATFINGWDPAKFPDSIEQKVGLGFKADIAGDFLFTKYPPGVAILEAPIFLITHGLTKLFASEKANGFTQPYQVGRIIAVHLYLFIGLYCIALLCLRFGQNINRIIPLLLVLVFGTNIWYSMIWQPCMSHLYSFSLISMLLYAIHLPKKRFYWLIIGLLLGLIGCTRLVNLVLLGLLAIGYYSIFVLEGRKVRAILHLGIGAFIGLLPQLLHSWYLRVKDLKAYQGEGFPYWLSPKIDAILWSPTNGIIIYTPVFAAIIGLVIYHFFKKRNAQSFMIVSLFVAITYIYASWWYPTMGCCIGHRSFIEFLPIFFLPFITNAKIKIHWLIWMLIALACLYTTYLAYKYPGCLDDGLGSNPWKWSEYLRLWN